jgi:hypothetical protein
LLLALASALVLRSESRRTHDHILLSQIRDSPNLEARSQYSYRPGTGWPSYTPRHWVPFLSPFTTRGATVEVIRIRLHTLEGLSAIPWRINSRRTEYKHRPQECLKFLRCIRCRAGMNWSSRVSCYDRRSVGQSAPEQGTYLRPTTRLLPKIIVHCLNNYPKHVIIFLILQTFNRLPRLNRKRWIGHIATEIH